MEVELHPESQWSLAFLVKTKYFVLGFIFAWFGFVPIFKLMQQIPDVHQGL
jgi:hypothetical protein